MSYRTILPCLLLTIPIVLLCGSLSAQRPRPLESIAEKLNPTRTVVYKTVGDRQLRLHIFDPSDRPANDGRCVFLMIHGGGWTGGDARKSYPLADHFSRLGAIGVSLEYRLINRSTNVTVFDCVKDARSAVRYLRSHAGELGIDVNRIVVAGASAGGHLAAGTAMFNGIDEASDDLSISCRPDALVLYYPVIDTSEQGYGQQKIGKRWRELSPVDHVRSGLPPTILFHGSADTVTPIAGAIQFQERMTQLGNRCQLVSQKGGSHGYFIFDLDLYHQVMDRTFEFLKTQDLVRQ
jgi:acetyl esterase